jgi:hypothetical protein
MQTREQKIENVLIRKMVVKHPVNEVPNTSNLFDRTNRCFEVKLERVQSVPTEDNYVWLYAYTGPGMQFTHIAEVVYWNLENAEQYGGWEDFDTWNRENDGGYYERELGKETAELYYQHSKDCYEKLVKIFGEDGYEELAACLR